MRRLPEWTQWLLTELTGKALPGVEPPFRWTAGGRLVQNLLTLLLGLALSWFAVKGGDISLVLLLPGWLLTVAAMRVWQTSFVHHAAHDGFVGRFIAESLSMMLWIQPLSGYKPDHVLHHAKTATDADADLRFLVALGFKPGGTLAGYRIQLWRMMWSPSFHLRYAGFRLRANFVSAPLARKLAAIAWTLALVVTAQYCHQWVALATLWLVPAWPLYQMAGLCQLLTEHNWVRVGTGHDPARMVIARLTNARFFGEALPEGGWLAMARWACRMLLVHLPQRLIVAQGDLPNHDWHHRRPIGDWPNAAYARRDDLLAGSPGWQAYKELWGFSDAVNETFALLASLPVSAVLGDPMTYEEKSATMLDM